MKRSTPLLSVVIPCYNEAENVGMLFQRLQEVLGSMELSCECVFVDDGSTDGTLDTVKNLPEHAGIRVRYVSLSRNFGHQRALLAGLRVAAGDAVITMDADLQHPPSLIPQLLAKWREGYEVVHTLRADGREVGFLKRVTSALFYRLMNFLTGLELPKGAADFRLLDCKVVDVLARNCEDSVFLRGMVCWYGFRQTALPYAPGLRKKGVTKYSFLKMAGLALDGFTAFSVRPLRLALLLAGGFALFGIVELAYVIYIACFTSLSVSGWASIAVLISASGSATLLVLGIVGEYVGRAFMQGKRRPQYVVRETNCRASFTNLEYEVILC